MIKPKTIEIQTILVELFEGEIAGGRNFWWTEGSDVILTQEWNHRASGRDNEAVEAYHMVEVSVTEYIKSQWDEYMIKDIVEVQGL